MFFPLTLSTSRALLAPASTPSILRFLANPGTRKDRLIFIRILHHRSVEIEAFKSQQELGGRLGAKTSFQRSPTTSTHWNLVPAATFEEPFRLRLHPRGQSKSLRLSLQELGRPSLVTELSSLPMLPFLSFIRGKPPVHSATDRSILVIMLTFSMY